MMFINSDPYSGGRNRMLTATHESNPQTVLRTALSGEASLERCWSRANRLRELFRRRSLPLTLFAILALAVFLLFISIQIATAADTAPVYSVEEVGTLGGSATYSQDLNDAGQVVGCSELANGKLRPFIYEDGQMRDLGTLGGDFGCAYKINEAGQVAGSSRTITGHIRSHAFIYSDSQMKDLGTLGGNQSIPYDINESGEVVGYSYASSSNSDYRAFLYSGGRMRDLQSLLEGGNSDSYSFATAINNSGQAVGYSRRSGSTHSTRAFLYSDGRVTELGGLGGNLNVATSINESGQVAGTSSLSDGRYRAVIHSNGQVKDLGVTGDYDGSSVQRINENGDVIGQLSRSGDGINRSFLYGYRQADRLSLPRQKLFRPASQNGQGEPYRPRPRRHGRR